MINEKLIHIVIDALPATESSWIDILSALLVPAIAVLGIYIAYQQYSVNKQRLRHETYERRLAIYKSVQKYLSEIMREANTTFDRALQFNYEASEATFLFDSSVQNKIDEIYKKSIDMAANYEKLYPSDGSPGLPKGPERNKVVKSHYEFTQWHADQLNDSRQFFAKKLGLNVQ